MSLRAFATAALLIATVGPSYAQDASAWGAAAVAKINARLVKPPREAFPPTEAVVRIGFTVNRAGEVSDVKMEQSSGSDVLDQAVLRAVVAASPLPKITWPTDTETLSFVAPFRFRRR